jgi:hypothetical protein
MRYWFRKKVRGSYSVLLLVVALYGCTANSCQQGCSGCQPRLTCEQCIQHCVETEGVSADACRIGDCAGACRQQGATK